MKFNFNFQKKEASMEMDAERLIEKGMDNYENDWKEKFEIKHNAKKELNNQKHIQKVELENIKQNRKNILEKLSEQKTKRKEMEIQERIRKEKEERKKIILCTIFLIGMIIICFIMSLVTGN